MQPRRLRMSSILVLLSLFLFACDIGALSPSKPTVIIVSPPSGSQYREGEDITIQSTSTDSSGIVRVELLVDGTVVRTDPSPSAQVSYPLVQTWKATAGSHTLSVRAYNASNAVSAPAAVTVTVAPATSTSVPNVSPTTPSKGGVATPIGGPTASTEATTVPGVCTNAATFVADVTVPDGTVLAPGQTFNKIWRLRNSGTCTWSADYQFAFIAGEAMSSTTVIGVPNTAPGATADFLIAMAAPTANGNHTGQWRLRSPAGTLFGITVNVTINVLSTPPTPVPATPPPVGCAGTPNIASFTASPPSITPGGTSTLNWGLVSNADSVEIDQGLGGVGTPGNVTVNPTATTTYTLTARCGNNTRTAQVTVTVSGSAFAVTGVTATANPATYSGACPKQIIFNAVVTVNGPGTVTYKWERSDGATESTATSITFTAAGSQVVGTYWNLGSTGTGWELIHILTPNNRASNQANFSITCN